MEYYNNLSYFTVLFLYLKAKGVNICLKITTKIISHGQNRENKFQSSEKLRKNRHYFIISFVSPVLSSVSYEVQIFFSTFGNEFFEKLFYTVTQTFAIRSKLSRYKTFVNLLLEFLVDSLSNSISFQCVYFSFCNLLHTFDHFYNQFVTRTFS